MENAHNYYYWILFFWYLNEYKDICVFCGNLFKTLDSQTFGHLIHLQLRKVIKAKIKHNNLNYMNAILVENFSKTKNSYLIHVCCSRVLYAFNNEKKVKKKKVSFDLSKLLSDIAMLCIKCLSWRILSLNSVIEIFAKSFDISQIVHLLVFQLN